MASKFLDSTGLNKLWSKICTIFAPKWLAYRPSSDLGKSSTQLVITHTSAGTSGDLGKNILVTLPGATESEAGLLIAADKKKLNELETKLATNSKYKSSITPTTTEMPSAVGGFPKGTKVSDLSGKKTYNDMFDELLFPTMYPTYVAPSASIAFKNYNSIQEVGATGPTSSNFTPSYNAGGIYIGNDKQNNRGGTLKTGASYSYIYVNNNTSNKTLPSKVTLGNTTFKYRAAYNAGPQPKDNKGNNYDSPLAAGTVDSAAITLNGTYPIYAPTATLGQFVKQPLVAWNSTAAITSGEISLPAQADGAAVNYRQLIDVPYPDGRSTTVKVEFYNTLSGKWDTVTSTFSYSNITRTLDTGISVNYRRYYFNSPMAIGPRKFKITF